GQALLAIANETFGQDTHCLQPCVSCRISFLDVCSRYCYTFLMNNMLIRTISIKLDIGEHEAALRETQQRFNVAALWIAYICWHEHITNTNTAHHRVYGETRTHFDLGAQLAVCARA